MADRPYPVLHPRARASGTFDRLRWAVRRRPASGESAEGTEVWVDAGRGRCTTLRLWDEGCPPTEYVIRVTAADERGAPLATAIRTVAVDLRSC